VPTSHEERVQRVREQVLLRPAGQRLTIAKSHPGHTPHDLGYKKGCHPVQVGELTEILAIDQRARTATVEGQVLLGDLCRRTLEVGLMPKVVPEFETFTISGLVNGLGIETSSHRHGVFPVSLRALEVVLGNGEVVEADKNRNPDLLAWLPGSYGTLGIVTRATLDLIEAKQFVRSRYRHFERRGDYVAAFGEALSHHEFVEGFVLGRRSFVLITSDYDDGAAAMESFEAMAYGNQWYYQHALRQARQGAEDRVPAYQYMFRHQRSLFWLVPLVADLKIFTHTRRGRAYLDRATEKKVRADGFRHAMPLEIAERSVFNQDMGVRLSRLEEGLDYVAKNLEVYPLWNCPAGICPSPLAFVTPRTFGERPEMVVDIGVYGEPRKRGIRCQDALRALQKFVDVPALWGVSYLSREELRACYDFDAFEAVQRKYHARDAFVPLESKMRFANASATKQSHVKWWRLVRVWYEMKASRAARRRLQTLDRRRVALGE
jgi:FAD/FMN-containing dehydrogenase